jgi:hypothetical protein
MLNPMEPISPLLIEKSPFVFGSPLIRPTQLTPWAGDFLKTPGKFTSLFSPRMDKPGEISFFQTTIDSIHKE